MYFDPLNVGSFPSSTSGMSGLRYSQILKAINTNSSQVPKPRFQNGSTDWTISRDVTSSGLWRPPMLANDLIMDVASPFAYDSEDSEEGNQTSNDKEAGKDIVAYAYFSNRHLIVRRKNQRLSHVPCTCGKQVSCIWCCRCDDNHVNGKKHCRYGGKTSWVCVTCQVPLCKVKRYDGKSCFELFHEAEELFNPCCVTARRKDFW